MTIRTARHMVIPDFMQVRVRAPASAAIIPWWLSGGVTAANCLAAYTAKGAASLAASYDNNAAPGNGLADGTYDAGPGVAPTFDAATGWTFNGSSQYLTTGITPAVTWSALCQFSDATGTGFHSIFGYFDNGAAAFLIQPARAAGNVIYYNGRSSSNYVIQAPALTAGNLGIAGKQGYRNGVADGGVIPTTAPGAFGAIFLGCVSNVGTPAFANVAFKMRAFAIYNTTLTAPQVAAITTAMNAL